MKTFADYIAETQQWMTHPAAGDDFAIELEDGTLLETWIMDIDEDAMLLDATPEILESLASWYEVSDQINEDLTAEDLDVVLEGYYGGLNTGESAMEEEDEKLPPPPVGFKKQFGMPQDTSQPPRATMTLKKPERCNPAFQNCGGFDQPAELLSILPGTLSPALGLLTYSGDVHEAEYQGHKVPLGKPMRGDVKKFKVYVRDPKTGNIKKVNFGHGGKSARRLGQKTMRIKKSNPARRKSFRARHHCDNPGPRTKARYWSCRAW